MRLIYQQYLTYIAFALVAITINISVQALSEFLLKEFTPSVAFQEFFFINKSIEFWFLFALGLGTVTGFLFKFVVDKWIVFKEILKEEETLKDTGKQFSIYLLFAIFTTFIFWGTEGFFYLFFPHLYLLGGIIGLAIGYTVKFYLDRRYCFCNDE